MQSLESLYAELESKLGRPNALNPQQADPIYYVVYPPSEALAVRKQLPVWMAALRNGGWDVELVSAADLLWNILDGSGYLEEWVKLEAMGADQEAVNAAVRNCLSANNNLIKQVGELVASEAPGKAVFIVDVELLHPFFRTHTIENALHDRVKVPLVFFYPGRRSGQYGLKFLGIYPEDGSYRSVIIGE